jgi:competence protein ComEC
VSDRSLLVLASLALAVALAAPALPPVACLLFVALWFATRRPLLLGVAMLVLIGGRANEAVQALTFPLPDRVSGVGQLVSDPVSDRFGSRFQLRIGGRRYLARLASDKDAAVRRMLAGQRLVVSGAVRPLVGVPAGWARSEHLAGRIDLDGAAPSDRGPPWYRVANWAHQLVTGGATTFDSSRRSLYLGLVIGDDRGQDDLTRFRFEASGLTHLLAVSGSNVGFVLAAAAVLLRRAGMRWRVGVGLVVLGLFVLVTRAEPSVLRAGMMAAVALVAASTGRMAPGRRVLGISVLALLLVDPLLVHSIGFRLSVAATAGLLVLAGPIAEALPGPRVVAVPLGVSLAAQLATAPILVALAGGVPLAALPANLLAGPAAGGVMVLGVSLGPVSGLFGHRAAGVLQLPARILVTWIDTVASLAAGLPLPVLDARRVAAVAAGLGALVAASRAVAKAERRWVGPVRLVAACCVAAACWPAGGVRAGVHELGHGVVLGVGRCGGAAVSIRDPGPPRRVLAALWRTGVRRIDVLVAGPSRREAATAALVADQFAPRMVLTLAERAPPGTRALAESKYEVGGLRIENEGEGRLDELAEGVAGSAGLISDDGRRCSVDP